MNEKIKKHLIEQFKELCQDEDFCTVSAAAIVGIIVCFLGYLFWARACGYGIIAIATLYGSLIGFVVLAETIRAYGQSEDGSDDK